MSRKHLSAGLILLIVLVLAGFVIPRAFLENGEPITPIPEVQTRDTVSINGGVFSVDIADTSEERAQGLSGREALLSDEGMLFIFGESSTHSFWMKEMKFPIDIIFTREKSMAARSGSGPEDLPPVIFRRAPAGRSFE